MERGDDPTVLQIFGPRGNSNIYSEERTFKTGLQSNLRAIVIACNRLVEEVLALAVKQGVRQYVILYAGLDTFAYRNPYAERSYIHMPL